LQSRSRVGLAASILLARLGLGGLLLDEPGDDLKNPAANQAAGGLLDDLTDAHGNGSYCSCGIGWRRSSAKKLRDNPSANQATNHSCNRVPRRTEAVLLGCRAGCVAANRARNDIDNDSGDVMSTSLCY